MFENGKSQEHTDREIFESLLETLGAHDDAGIAEFEGKVKKIHGYLSRRYVNKKRYLTASDIDDIETGLNGDWGHTGDIAHIGGQIYLYDLEEADEIAELLGNPAFDEESNNDCYYIVDDIRLRSAGFTVKQILGEDGAIQRIRIGYLFALPDDEDENPALCAYADDLYLHSYETPTFQEAARQLKHTWPNELKFIDEWLNFEGNTSIPARLHYIAGELQAKLSESDKFRECVQIYASGKAGIDKEDTTPFRIIATGQVERLESNTNPYQGGGVWRPFLIRGQLERYGFAPKIEYIKRKDGGVDCVILVATYNQPDGYAQEYLRFNTMNLCSFINTRASQSLAAMALGMNEQQSDTIVGGYEAAQPIKPAHVERMLAREKNEPEVKLELAPLKIEKYREAQLRIDALIRRVVNRSQVMYEDEEQAAEAALALWNNHGQPLMAMLMEDPYAQYIVSHEGTRMPNGDLSFSPGEETGRAELVYSVDREAFDRALEPGDSCIVTLDSMMPHALKIVDLKNDTVRYTVNMRMTGHYRADRYVMRSDSKGNPIDALVHEQKVTIDLCDAPELKIKELNEYKQMQEIIASLDGRFEKSAIVKLAKAMNHALLDLERHDVLVPFEQIDLFKAAAEELQFLDSEPATLQKIVDIFSHILVGKQIMVTSEMYSQKEDGSIHPVNEEGDVPVLHYGKVVNVRGDIDGSELFIAVAVPGYPALYARFGAVSLFRF